eukprot:2138355-Amphidinium_carterae.1
MIAGAADHRACSSCKITWAEHSRAQLYLTCYTRTTTTATTATATTTSKCIATLRTVAHLPRLSAQRPNDTPTDTLDDDGSDDDNGEDNDSDDVVSDDWMDA